MDRNFTIEFDREEDDRWIAEATDFPGALSYGRTREEAWGNVVAIVENIVVHSGQDD
jgi:predicted RNase H-like HicB family nuclease